MADAEVKTWEEELTEIVQTRATLQTTRENLRYLLEEDFGPLPEAWSQRIEATTDLQRLRAALLQTKRLKNLDDLQL